MDCEIRRNVRVDAQPDRRHRELPGDESSQPSRPTRRRWATGNRPANSRADDVATAELRLIRRRIRTVKSTMKITRAMELIAASRIVQGAAGDRGEAVHGEDERGDSQRCRCVRRRIAPAARPASGQDGRSDRGDLRSWSGRRLQLERASTRRSPSHRTQAQWCRGTRVYAVGKKAQTYFQFRGTRSSTFSSG